jgi:hypothetical protein
MDFGITLVMFGGGLMIGASLVGVASSLRDIATELRRIRALMETKPK